MNKYITAIMCSILMLLTACAAEQKPVVQVTTDPTTSSATEAPAPNPETENRYKRISFDSETLGEDLENHVSADTVVTITADDTLPTQMPIYEIKERPISEEEFQQMLDNLELGDGFYEPWCQLTLDNNEINGTIAPFDDPKRGYFGTLEMTDEELEAMAWETLGKIPFLEGEYVYTGIVSSHTIITSEGEIATRVGVGFSRVLDGVIVTGHDICDLFFDGSGLVEMHLTMYDYEQIGTMDVVPLDDAKANIKTPDAFSSESDAYEKDIASTLQVERIQLLLVNQYTRGCTILQPLYNFVGTATLGSGSETRFSSRVIAIPESYTYETEAD